MAEGAVLEPILEAVPLGSQRDLEEAAEDLEEAVVDLEEDLEEVVGDLEEAVAEEAPS